MVKIATFFLIGILIIALFGRWILPLLGIRTPPRLSRFCPDCGKLRNGPDACQCGGRR